MVSRSTALGRTSFLSPGNNRQQPPPPCHRVWGLPRVALPVGSRQALPISRGIAVPARPFFTDARGSREGGGTMAGDGNDPRAPCARAAPIHYPEIRDGPVIV